MSAPPRRPFRRVYIANPRRPPMQRLEPVRAPVNSQAGAAAAAQTPYADRDFLQAVGNQNLTVEPTDILGLRLLNDKATEAMLGKTKVCEVDVLSEEIKYKSLDGTELKMTKFYLDPVWSWGNKPWDEARQNMIDEEKEKEEKEKKEKEAQKDKEKDGSEKKQDGEGEGEKKEPIDNEMYREWQRAVREIRHERAPKPALVYLHGGGFISGSVELFRKDIIRYVNMTSMTIYAPEYRLAPEHKFPKPLEDAFAAAQWIRENAGAENIDPERIGLLGVSAGGALALGVAMMWQDKGIEPPIGRVCAVYPMLNHQSTAVGNSKRAKFINIWTEKGVKMAWDAYLPRTAGQREKDLPYADPFMREDLSGFPPTYIDVGGLDLFAKDVAAFVARLAEANVKVEFHCYPGVPHAFDYAAPDAIVSREAIQHRREWLRQL